jgi:small subunit ribosomal protein S17e
MGRIKTQLVKRTTMELVKRHRDKFKTNFEENKVLVREFAEIKNKKLRNIVAGYVTRLLRNKEEI